MSEANARTRKVPSIFVGARTGKVKTAGANFGKEFITINTIEVSRDGKGGYKVCSSGSGKNYSPISEIFKWASEWNGLTDFSNIKPLDYINLIVEDVGSKSYVVNIEFAEASGMCEKLFNS